MGTCARPDLGQHLYRFVRGELPDPDIRSQVERHIQGCGACAGVYRELQWILGTMRRPGGAGYETELERLGALVAPERRPGLLARLWRKISTRDRQPR